MLKRSKFSELIKNLSYTEDGESIGTDVSKLLTSNTERKPRAQKEKNVITFSRDVTKPKNLNPTEEEAYQAALTEEYKSRNNVDVTKNPRKIKKFDPDTMGKIPVIINDKTTVYVKREEDVEKVKARYLKLLTPLEVDLIPFTGKTKVKNDIYKPIKLK